MAAQDHPVKGTEKHKPNGHTVPWTGALSVEQLGLINEKIAYDVYEVITSIIDISRRNPGHDQNDADQHDVMVIDFLDLVNAQASGRLADEDTRITPLNRAHKIATQRTLEKESMS